MSLIDASNLFARDCSNQAAPPDGPKAIPVSLDFSALATYTLDYSNAQNLGKFSMLQAVYVDNSTNGSAVSITVTGTGQVLTVPANSQAYLPILVGNPIFLTFTSNGNVSVTVFLLNFPVAPAIWHV